MSRPSIVLPQGTYRGTILRKDPGGGAEPLPVEAFLGIPYARVPLRFSEAVPPPSSDKTFDAGRHGPVCPTMMEAMDEMEGRALSESECLNVNVFRQVGAHTAVGSDGSEGESPRLPVVVYFHGGAFNFGNGAARDMASFTALAAKPVVGVSFNYRLGPLGFLACAAAERQGLLNLGLRDQKMLLQWLRDNIGAFGGDARQVTLMGVSAGAHSIGHHILSADATAPLFQKAIIESGAATARLAGPATNALVEEQVTGLLRAANLSHVDPSSDEVLISLRKLPLSDLNEAAGEVWSQYEASVRWPFQPVLDDSSRTSGEQQQQQRRQNAVIPKPSLDLWSSDAGIRTPLITGFTSHEGAMFVPARAKTNDEFRRFFHTLLPQLTESDFRELDELYPDSTDGYTLKMGPATGAQFPRLATAFGHFAYVAPVLYTAHCFSRAGSPVYLYEYAALCHPFRAANHASQGDIVARDTAELRGAEGLQAVAEKMHGLFSRFAASEDGDPNLWRHTDDGGSTSEQISWPRFVSPFVDKARPEAGQIIVFGEGNDERASGKSRGSAARLRTLTDLEIRQTRFWWAKIEQS